MVIIRLKRIGRKNNPSYRVVVTDSRRAAKKENSIEQIGFYNPFSKEFKVDEKRVEYWTGVGAQVSDTLHNLLVSNNIFKMKKKNVLPKKTPIKKEVSKEEKSDVAKAEVKEEVKEDKKEGVKKEAEKTEVVKEEVKKEVKTEEKKEEAKEKTKEESGEKSQEEK